MVDDPFVQLLRCHRKLEERMADLARTPGDDEAREDFFGFLDRAIRRHEDDEEASLFPRLSNLPAVAATITTLREEHRVQAGLQQALRDARDEPAIIAALEALRAAYGEHLALEETVLFPAAREHLDEAARRSMMDEMQARRGRTGGGGGGGRGHGRTG